MRQLSGGMCELSGPALTIRDSHHAIHEAAFLEAEELTVELRRCVIARDEKVGMEIISMLMEHWQHRILCHATEEEEGLYQDIGGRWPKSTSLIATLIRDHELLRILVMEIQTLLDTRRWTAGIVERFEALLLINAIHSRQEEEQLLAFYEE